LPAGNPSISIIIPTKNSGETLGKCLEALARQTFKPLEVIVVDSFSTDSTVEIAENWGAKVLRKAGTQASARNLGVEKAKGEYVLFLDSDQLAGEGLLAECANLCLKGFEAVKIPETFHGRGFWASCSALWRNTAASVEEAIPRLYKRETLLKAGLFQENLKLWEDLELYWRVKALGVKEGWSKIGVSHLEASSLLSLLRKAFSYGQSIPAFNRKAKSKPQKGKLKATLSTLRRLLSQPNPPTQTLGCLLLAALKAAATLLGIITGWRGNR